jgi:hypothetical protein
MAKKGKKKDPEKKFALQAAKEAKAEKKAQKRLQKEARRELSQNGQDAPPSSSQLEFDRHDDGIDMLLEAYQKHDLEVSSPLVEILSGNDLASSYSHQDRGQSKTTRPYNPDFPYPPRGNFTLTLCPTSNELYMFGGEYFDGVENLVFDELLCWNPDSKPDIEDEEVKKKHKHGIWRRIISPQPRPPARCSHSTVYYNNALYVFGGEMATAENYHHYKDIWKFDIKTNLWTEIKPRNKGGPTSRSGHRAIVWRHYMIIFGGFYEAVREAPRWFNDLHIYDFSTNSWIECNYSKLATIPPERSAFNFGLLSGTTDVAYVSGGYSKLKNPMPGTKAEGRVHTDCWALHLKCIENGKTPTWERTSRKGEYPSQRSGTACCMWKNKMLVYGGVEDEETENHRLNSVFFDDLFAFDMERKRWFRLNLKKKTGDRRRRRKDDPDEVERGVEATADDSEEDEDEAIEGEATSSGWDLAMLRSNMFAFIDGEGNLVFEKIEDEVDISAMPKKEGSEFTTDIDTGYEADEGERESSSNVEDSRISVGSKAKTDRTDMSNMVTPAAGISVPNIAKSEVMIIGEDGTPKAASRKSPLPRIKSQIVVRGNTLYVYGGILEVGDREVTLDDIWSLDLQKREEWVCIHPGTMHRQVWKGAESDNESYISTDRGTGGNESDDEEEEFCEFDDVIEDSEDEEAAEAARKAAKKAAKKEIARGIREEIRELNEKLSLYDPNNTPKAGEELADFYARTVSHWAQKASALLDDSIKSNEELSAKELKREGFSLARERYDELRHVLGRLHELEIAQKEREERKESKKTKKEKKDKDKKKDRRR